jgi:tetratricopeptide (TPR) repeat protein
MTLLRAVAAAILAGLAYAVTPAGAQAPDRAHADALYKQGDVRGALAAIDQVLAKSPNEPNAVFDAARFDFDLNKLDAARAHAEHLVKLVGNNAIAWELLTQIAQAQNDLTRRDEALEQAKIAIRSAINPDVRARAMLIRDHFRTRDGLVLAVDYFDRDGPDFTRYQFTRYDPAIFPDLGILLRTDTATTQSWSETALLPPDKRLFHLDMVDRKQDGGDVVAIYKYYVGEPSYDVVRADVMKILRGEIKPLSGVPGTLAGRMKP